MNVNSAMIQRNMSPQKKPSRPVRLSRADQKLKRTGQLLEAAWQVFREKGYEGTTIDEVAEYAGVSRFPVFYAFGDKQNLFLELWKEKVKESFEVIEPRVKRGASLSTNLRALAQLLVENHASHSTHVDSLFFVVQTIALSRADIAAKLEEISASMADYFSGIIAASKLEAGQQLRAPAKTVGAHLLAIIHGLNLMRFQIHRAAVNVDDVFDTFSTVVIRPRKAGQ
jgi:AcrR family transcriptional regulator